MKILTARLASEDRFWSRTILCSLPEALDGSCGIWVKRYWWKRWRPLRRKRSDAVSWSIVLSASGRLWLSREIEHV
ncbi:hypothetical protein H5410_036543 [Solanum commersonii]|uniref:Uncharacterized protein n=1 Tax=Solanum commersonii TaxID=4109 RepID=A0A9J5Y5Y1_SOLCO|nr:hypothetical protein H5410_036543 [Solanum commersonii]